jgi:Xaa-Pro dipeptidase
MRKESATAARVNVNALRRLRFKQVKERMKEFDVDVILSFRLENIRYISDLRPVWGEYLGMATRYCCLVGESSDGPALFVDESEIGRCKEDLKWTGEEVLPMRPIDTARETDVFVSKKLVPKIEELGKSKGKIAVDITSITLIDGLRRELPGATIIDGDFFLKQAKMLKNSEEIKLLRKAATVADAGINRARENLRPGRRECEIVGYAYEAMQSMGMERPQVASICASGERTVPLHRLSSGRIIQHGDFVFIDIGACYGGYFSDETRTVPVGRPDEKARDVYRAVYSALQCAIAKLRPGNRTVDVHLAARNAIKEAGYEKYGYYGLLGHGIGTSGQEAPVVGEIVTSGEQQVTLQPGMCFTLEPGIFVPGVVGIRLEDNVLITESGAEVLTRVPYEEDLIR